MKLHKECADAKISYVTDQLLKRGHDQLLSCCQRLTSPESLQAVAQIMISIHVLADILKEQSPRLGLTISENSCYFVREAEKWLQNDSLNDKKTSNGPIWYLVRYIIRTFGVSTLFKISKIDTLEWVLPFDDFPQVC